MPVRIDVDEDLARRVSLMTGVISDVELIAAYRSLIDSPDFDPSLDDLVDASRVVRVDVTPHGVREVAQIVAAMDAVNPGTRIALIAPGGAAFVMARLYTFYREAQQAPAEHRVFRDRAAAEAWLDDHR